MVCCIASCAMIPAAPARSAGLVRSEPGPFANSTNPLIWPLFPFTTPVLRPVFELSLSPCFLTSCADSLVSFTQRPELAAISEPACAAAAPVLRTDPSRGSPRSFDDVSPSETRYRSTSEQCLKPVDLPGRARGRGVPSRCPSRRGLKQRLALERRLGRHTHAYRSP